jgi:fumarylacetoacetate (FAA) hydrolase
LDEDEMKLASLKNGMRDGSLVVVSKDLSKCVAVPAIAKTMQAALDAWDGIAPQLEDVSLRINSGLVPEAKPFHPRLAAAPLPRAYQFADGSFYEPHVALMSAWRKMSVPPMFFEEPFVYQGCSDELLGPCDPIPMGSPDWGLDFEAEIAVIVDGVPASTPAARAAEHIKLVMICNDVSLRGLIPRELSKEFGFYQSKPPSAFSPVAVTPDELGASWDGNHLHRPVRTTYNDAEFGCPLAGHEAVFGFKDLIAHLTKTRSLGPGTILGSGTVSNSDRSVGSSCLAERRAIETMETGSPATPWMNVGDRVRIEVCDDQGRSIFGAIDQIVVTLA